MVQAVFVRLLIDELPLNFPINEELKLVYRMKIASKYIWYNFIEFSKKNSKHLFFPSYILCFKQYKIDCRVTIELLDTESDETEKCVTNTQAWSNYVELLSNPAAGPNTSNNNAATCTDVSSAGGVSGRSTTIDGTNNTNSTNQEQVEVKIEKPDDELVC